MKPGRGIDGSKGENFTKVNRGDPLTVRPDCAANERSYSRLDSDNGGDKWGEYGDDQMNGMRNKRDFQFRGETRDIWADVLENDGTRPSGGFSGPIKAGVNRSQEILMLAHKQTKGAATEPSLEQRIAEFRKHLDSFILARAVEIQKSSSGVPLETIMVMLGRNSGCQCAIAEKVIGDRKRDADIAARQESK